MKRRQFLAILLTLALLVSLAGCGQSGGQTDPDGGQTGDAPTAPVDSTDSTDSGGASQPGTDGGKPFTMGVIVKLEVAWFDRLDQGLQQYAAETGNEVFMLTPTSTDAAQQVQMVEDLIAQQVDVIGIVPNSAEALETVLQKARDQGIKVVSHEAPTLRSIDLGVEAFTDEDFGVFFMEALAQAMEYQGEYATIIESLTNANHNTWLDAAVAHQEANYPDMTLVSAKSETRGDVNTAQSVCEELLKTYPDLKGILGTGSADVPGACLAVENRGLSGSVAVVGCTSPNDAAPYLNDGTCTMIGVWDPANTGYAMCKLAELLVNGQEELVRDGYDLGLEGFESITVVDGKYVIGSAMLGIHAGDDMSLYPF